jgi:hypothetical protein
LQKRGWPNNAICPLCSRSPESIDHLLVHCRFTQRLWDSSKRGLGYIFLTSTHGMRCLFKIGGAS